MTSIHELTCYIIDKTHFLKLKDYRDFTLAFLEFIDQGLQAKIVCQNETNYQFFQYRQDCSYHISRPINMSLFGSMESFDKSLEKFNTAMKSMRAKVIPPDSLRFDFVRVIYTFQQSIGAALDALPSERSNQAKKINGELFERLIRLLFHAIGVDCRTGTLSFPVKDNSGKECFTMNSRHDLIAWQGKEIRFIGSVKTSSKDRMDKIFVDKLLFERLSGLDIPYIAVFLNDVQRAKSKIINKYRINSTFLSGHFKAYSIRLTPLDGVFYCDLRPAMKNDPFLSERIEGIDSLFFNEVLEYMK